MNKRLVLKILGATLLIEAATMLPSYVVALVYHDPGDGEALLKTILMMVFLGLPMWFLAKPRESNLRAREGFVIVALAWLGLSGFGALPFVFSGYLPNYIDALFEAVSGFTTTGATVVTNFEHYPHGVMFWRSFTHWIGGMGVLVLTLALLPQMTGRTSHLVRAESPGPSLSKIVPKMGDSAKILYLIYAALTALQFAVLLLAGMNPYDAAIHTFGTAGTGGFSHLSLSIGAYNNPYFEIVIAVFMLLFGINFNLYYFLLLRRFRDVFRSEELLVYLGVVAVSVAAIAANISHLYGTVSEALRHAFFQVSSIITTTGFATVNFNLWPTFSKAVLVALMFFGGCAGSTAGGLKIARIVILLKSSFRDLQRMIHPHAVTVVRLEGKPLEDKTVRGAYLYLSVFVMLFAVSALLLSLEHFDLVTTFTAVAACINNVGPGLELVGPVGSFSEFSQAGKLLLSFDMLLGRLEIFPMLVVCAPSIWARKRRKAGA